MEFDELELKGLVLARPRVFEDGRGFFFESYNADAMERAGLNTRWQQDNHARSQKDTIRGMHFALGKGQIKMIRCIRGSMWDVVVDIRPDSPTLGKWKGVELTAENKQELYVPVGFAHGYAALSDDMECVYKCSETYDPKVETEILWNDPEVGIEWPVKEPVLSDRDRGAQTLRQYLAAQGKALK